MTKISPDFKNYPSLERAAVWVIWNDSVFQHVGWQPEISTKERGAELVLIPYDTVGILLELNETKGYITVANSSRRDGSTAQAITIPLSCVYEIRSLLIVPSEELLWPKKKRK